MKKMLKKKATYILFCFFAAGILFFTENTLLSAAVIWSDDFSSGGSWYSASWTKRKKLTVPAGQAAGNLTSFPVLVLRTDTDLRDDAQDDGDDILFTSSDGVTKLNHEIEKFDGAAGELLAWVKLPSVSSGAATDFYIYYGNVSAVNQQNKTGVWDSNYAMVHHMNQNPAGTVPQMIDSTSNANNGTSQGSMTSGDLINCKIGQCLDLDGINDYIVIPNSTSLNITGNTITLQAWVRMPVPNSVDSPFIVKGPSVNAERYMLGVGGGSSPARINHRVTTTDGHFRYDTGAMQNETWYYVVAVYEGTLAANPRFRVYNNGALVSGSNASGNILTTTEPVQLGKRVVGDNRWYNGDLDEVRISNIARSATWIQTEYNNQNAPSSFVSFSSEENYTPSWVLDTGWSIAPATLSSGCNFGTDPDSDYSTTADDRILGYQIGGCYTNSIPDTRWATSPTINCSGQSNIHLKFYRSLGIEQGAYDHAYIQAYNGSTWTQIWQNGGSNMTEGSWSSQQDIDVSAYANNNANFRVRFGLGTTDTSAVGSGWNIDNISIESTPAPVVSEVGWWKMDEGGGQIVSDSSGNGRNGTLGLSTSVETADPTWTSGMSGTAGLSFDGAGDYVNIPDNDAFDFGASQDFTIAVWVKTTSQSTTYPMIVSKNDGVSPRQGYNVVLHAESDPRWYFEIFSAGNQYTVAGASNVADGGWHFLTVVRSGTNIRTYQDGVLANSYTSTGVSGNLANNLPINLGRLSNNTWNLFYNGVIDDARIYRRALSEPEIADLYNSSPVTPVSWWKLDEASGIVADDFIGTNNGTLVNGPVWQPTGGQVNGALLFDGSNDYVRTSSPATTVIDNWTMSAWIKPAVLPQAGTAVHNGYETGNTGDGYGFGISDGSGGAGKKLHGLASGFAWIDSGYTFPSANTWYHIVMLRSGGITKFYVNGVQTSKTSSQTYGVPTSNVVIGGEYPWSSLRFNGLVDEVRVYNWALTPAQVLSLYNSQSQLSVVVSANPSSTSNLFLNDVDLTATIDGSGTGNINYTFYCNCNDSGVNPGTSPCNPNDFKIDNVNINGSGGTVVNNPHGVTTWGGSPFSVADVCDYGSAGNYYAKVIAERGGYQAENRAQVVVGFDPGGDGINGTYLQGSVNLGSRIQNIDFENFDGYLLSQSWPVDGVTVVWRGAIYAPVTGIYNLRVDVNSTEYTSLYIGETEFWTDIGDQTRNVNIAQGWHSFWMMADVPDQTPDYDSKVRLYWKLPGSSTSEIIPQNYFESEYWADDIIVIPDVLKPRQSVEYVATGVGTRDVTAAPRIKIDVPPDVIKDEVLVFWAYSKDTNVTVTNLTTGVSRNIVGTVATSEAGVPIDVIYTKLPSAVINDQSQGQYLDLRFSNIEFTRGDGINIIVPYVDITRPKGRISFRVDGRHIYGGGAGDGSRAFIFPAGDDVLINEDLRPVFIMGDGESKHLLRRRPNFLLVLSGAGDPPAPTADLRTMGATIMVPEIVPSYPTNCLSFTNPDTWYPNYGREGQESDIISPNYVPNLINIPDESGVTNYIAHPLEGGTKNTNGTIRQISIPPNHTWIAFQYWSYDFDGACSADSPESGFFIGGGLFARRSILDEPAPVPPTTLSVSSPSCQTTDLSWTDNSTNEDTFEVERSTNGGTSWNKIADVLGVSGTENIVTYRDSSAPGGVVSYYRVRACSFEDCSTYSNEASAMATSCIVSDYTLSKSSDIKVTVLGYQEGTSTKTMISVTNPVSFSGPVTLSVDHVLDESNNDATARFSSPIFSPTVLTSPYSASSQFSIGVLGDTPPGTYRIYVKGSSTISDRFVVVYIVVDKISPGWEEF